MVLHTSRRFSRPLRVLSLAMNILTMLFLQALTYDLADPDDGTCEEYETEQACRSETSSLSSDASKCYWESSSSTCHFTPIDGEFYRIVLVAVLVAIIGTPFAFAIEAVISNILAADTVTNAQVKLRRLRRRAAQDPQLLRVSSSLKADGSQTTQIEILRRTQLILQRAEEALGCSLDEEFEAMKAEVIAYRQTLSYQEGKEFDSKSSVGCYGMLWFCSIESCYSLFITLLLFHDDGN